ncbi:hypothetical protein AB4Z54_30075, partial [Streptomyces sp. MCAF7]
EEQEFFEVTAVDTDMDGDPGGGRDLTGERPGDVDLAEIHTSAGLVDAPWREDDSVPYLLSVKLDGQDPDRLEVTFGDRTEEMSVGEFLEVMANDRDLMSRGLATRVVLSFSEPGPGMGALARRLAWRLGRHVWWTDVPTSLSEMSDEGLPVLTAPAGSAPDGGWREEAPPAPQSAEDAPYPVPRPLPKSDVGGATAPAALAGVGGTVVSRGVPAAPEAAEGSVPAEASPASPWDMARIRYAEEALDYEQRLATYLAADERINAELAKVVRAFWVLALHNGADYRKFGSDNPGEVGAVGTSFESLARVVESGNVRERVDFLFSGAKNELIPDLTGGKVRRHPVIKAERDGRRNTEAYTRYKEIQAELRAAGLD